MSLPVPFILALLLISDAALLPMDSQVASPANAQASTALQMRNAAALKRDLDELIPRCVSLRLRVEAERVKLDGQVLKQRALWSRCDAMFVLDQISGDLGADSTGIGSQGWFQSVGYSDGTGLLRGSAGPTRALGRISPLYEFDAIGLLDGSLVFAMFYPGESWEFAYRDLVDVTQRSPDSDTRQFHLLSNHAGERCEEMDLQFVRRGGVWSVSRFVHLLRPDAPNWNEHASWSRRTCEVTLWDGFHPKQVTTTTDRPAEDGSGVVHYRRTLTVLERAIETETESISKSVAETGKLRDGEVVHVDGKNLRFTVGSSIFEIGKVRFHAPEAITIVPKDIEALVNASTVLADVGGARVGQSE